MKSEFKKFYFVLALLFSSAPVFAWTIGPMNYQGRLLDAAGIPVTGSYNFKVRIYDAASGGVLKFSEEHNSHAVDDGVYAILVSTGSNPTGTWDINLWNTPTLYLEAEVNGDVLTPRHLLAATPFAYQANLALTTNNALALGGKPIEWFDSTLEAICVSSKGKWLELANGGAGACLGTGASFPGPTMVAYNTLTASSDFTNLDLSQANISGINFSDPPGAPVAANLTGTIFKQTTYAVAGFGVNVNLTDTVWDGAIATDVSPGFIAGGTGRLVGAKVTNMDLSKWNMSGLSIAEVDNFSAAYLTACPAVMSLSWECRLMYPAGSAYFLLGFGVNLSVSSAAAVQNLGTSYLDVDVNALNGAALTEASFAGNLIAQDFVNTTLQDADFSYSTISGSRIGGISGFLQDALFVGTKLNQVTFISSGGDINNANFSRAELDAVVFEEHVVSTDFTGAKLRNTYFKDVDGNNFTSAILDNVAINGSASGAIFDQTRFYNGFFLYHPTAYNPPFGAVFKDLYFSGGKLSGNFLMATFTGTLIFQNVTFEHLDLCGATLPWWNIPAPNPALKTVSWGKVECPNGLTTTGEGGDTCDVGTNMTPDSNDCAGMLP